MLRPLVCDRAFDAERLGLSGANRRRLPRAAEPLLPRRRASRRKPPQRPRRWLRRKPAGDRPQRNAGDAGSRRASDASLERSPRSREPAAARRSMEGRHELPSRWCRRNRPTRPGKVEVVEVFWYGCPHCYALDPYIESWCRQAGIRRVQARAGHVGPVHRVACQDFFYTLEALGRTTCTGTCSTRCTTRRHCYVQQMMT